VTLRWIARGLVGLLVVILGYILAAAAGGLIGNGHAARGGDVRIGLLIGPIHTDLLIPLTPDVRARFGFAADAGVPVNADGVQWLLLGWGAREFYTTIGTYADVTAHALWSGVTGDAAVLRLDVAGGIDDFSQTPLIEIDAVQFAALLDVIATEFARGADGAPTAIAHPGFTPTDQFFTARGPFNILRTCNVWVAETFAAAGISFGRWTPAPFSVRLALWRFYGTPL
jgi:uncharacterized protein (TIGR02117 family)